MKPLPICFYGHRRRKLAVLAIQRLKELLRFTGYEPRFIFGQCGTNEEYNSAVEEAAGDWLYRTLPMRQPDPELNNQLNQAMNDSLRLAFSISPVVLRMEDDWILQKELDIGPWCRLLEEDEGVCGVKLGQMLIEPDRLKPYRPDLGLDWIDYPPDSAFPVNNQIMLVHRRLYGVTGWYREDMTIDEAEYSLGRVFRVGTHDCKDGPKVLWPHGAQTSFIWSPDQYFVHAGASTLGHRVFTDNIPPEYLPYQE